MAFLVGGGENNEIASTFSRPKYRNFYAKGTLLKAQARF